MNSEILKGMCTDVGNLTWSASGQSRWTDGWVDEQVCDKARKVLMVESIQVLIIKFFQLFLYTWNFLL